MSRESFLVNSGDSMCVDCHGEPEHDFGQIKMDPVLGFGPETPSRVQAASAGVEDGAGGRAASRMNGKRVIAELDKANEQSNLKFSHQQHLDPDRVLRRGDSKPMNCADCHRLEHGWRALRADRDGRQVRRVP